MDPVRPRHHHPARTGTTAPERRQPGRGLAVLVATCCVLAGCSVPPGGTEEPVDIFEQVLRDARAGGAGGAQIAVLKEAADAQDLPLDAARRATQRAVRCMSDEGLEAAYLEQTTFSGVIVPGYQVEWVGERAHPCDTRYAFWVNQLHQLQPSTLAANTEYADQQEPALRTCLEGQGVATDPQATGSDLAEQAARTAPSCLGKAGIDTW